jgi:hypothetical protein
MTALPEDAGLADRLGLARASAEQARTTDQRSRASLYRALGHAYDFALAARANRAIMPNCSPTPAEGPGARADDARS